MSLSDIPTNLELGLHARQLGSSAGRVDQELMAIAEEAPGILISVEDGGTVRRWDLDNLECLDRFEVGELESCWAFSATGQTLAGGGPGVTLWDAPTGEQIDKLEIDGWPTTMTFDLEGRLLAVGTDEGGVRVYDVLSALRVHQFDELTSEISAIRFSRDGRYLIAASDDREVFIWDLVRDKRVGQLIGHTDRVEAIDWSFDDRSIYCASWDNSVRVWNAQTRELVGMLNGQAECVHSVLALPNGMLLSGDSTGMVWLWDPQQMKVIWREKLHHNAVKRLYMVDQTTLITTGTDRRINRRDLSAWLTSDHPLDKHLLEADIEGELPTTSAVASAHWMPASTEPAMFLALHREGSIWGWTDGPTPELSRTLSPSNHSCEKRCKLRIKPETTTINAFATLADQLITGDSAGQLHRWSYSASDQGCLSLPSLSWHAHHLPIRAIRIHPISGLIASTAEADGVVKIWDSTTGELQSLLPISEHACTIESMAFCPTRHELAVSGLDWNAELYENGCTYVYDLKNLVPVLRIDETLTQLTYSLDGACLAGVSVDGSVVIQSAESGEILFETLSRSNSVRSLAFSQDFLAVGCDDGSLRFYRQKDWSFAGMQEIDSRPVSMCFSPDGKRLFVANSNSTSLLLDLSDLS